MNRDAQNSGPIPVCAPTVAAVTALRRVYIAAALCVLADALFIRAGLDSEDTSLVLVGGGVGVYGVFVSIRCAARGGLSAHQKMGFWIAGAICAAECVLTVLCPSNSH